jgi:hypothetical protein
MMPCIVATYGESTHQGTWRPQPRRRWAVPVALMVLVLVGLAACYGNGMSHRRSMDCDDCGDNNGNQGQNAFSVVTVWRGYTPGNDADVQVDGVTIGTLPQATASPPACGSTTGPAWVSTTVTTGSHVVAAAEQGGGRTWGPWTYTFMAGDCAWIELP